MTRTWTFYLSVDAGVTYELLQNTDGSDYEPEGWDDIVFTLKRGPEGDEPWIDGADFVFSNTMTFNERGAEIIKGQYDLLGIDADVRIRIELAGCEYTFDGFVDFADYTEKPFCGANCGGEEVTIRLYKSGFAQLFKNRFDTQVDLSKTTTMDGLPMSADTAFEVKLHSKEILYRSSLKVNPALTEYVHNYEDLIVGPQDITPPFEIITGELEETLQPGQFSNIEFPQPLLYSGFSFPPGVDVRNIKVDGRIKFGLFYKAEAQGIVRHNGQINVFLEVRRLQTNTVLHTVPLKTGAFDSNNNLGFFVDETFDFTYAFTPDSNLFLRIAWIGERPSVSVNTKITVENTVRFDEVSNINFSENSIITPSSAKCYTIMNALNRVAESITGIANNVVSDFFSQGCYENMVITNGLNLRKMRDKAGNLFPISTSFKDLFDALDSIYCLGMRIEKTTAGERIRIEHRSFFYDSLPGQSFDYVPDVTMNVDLTHMYNEAEFGYSKWQTEDVNGLDEFNSRRLYQLPVKNVKKKLSRLCSFIAGGYLIEQTRRQQFKEKPTSDYSTDNDMFFICTNRSIVTSNLYEIDVAGDPVTATYAVGTVSERDESFINITNLLSPPTSYNLRISPERMASFHYPLLKVSLYKKTPLVKFNSGTGNYQVVSTDTSECSSNQSSIAGNSDLNDSNIRAQFRNALFIPETMEFVSGRNTDFQPELSFEDFLKAVSETTFRYEASCGNNLYVGGHIKTLNYRPNTEGGFGEFLLQRS